MIASLGVVAPEWSVVAPEWLGWGDTGTKKSVEYVECPFFAKLVKASFNTPPTQNTETIALSAPNIAKLFF